MVLVSIFPEIFHPVLWRIASFVCLCFISLFGFNIKKTREKISGYLYKKISKKFKIVSDPTSTPTSSAK